MTLPILAYGHSILRQKCEDIGKDFPNLDILIKDMLDTMQNASGCGLAAPQIGQKIRLFIVDSKTTYDNLEQKDEANAFEIEDIGIIETFINAKIINRSEKSWEDEEGCLSIPGLKQPVQRSWAITIEYFNQQFERQIKTFSGTTARMIQHEYDHIEGILYVDKLKPLKKKLLESKLKKIVNGHFKPAYPIKFV
jgi:peptide deformylase